MRAPTAGNLSAEVRIDHERIVAAVREIIDAIGEDQTREGLLRTPERIAAMYAELFSGLFEHHFLPFHGQAHVGYVPEGRIVGVSKIARAVDILARRPQMQERLTSQIADTLMRGLSPDGAAVVIEAEHLCLTMRGAQKPGTVMITSAIRGGFRRRGVTRAEFMALVQGK